MLVALGLAGCFLLDPQPDPRVQEAYVAARSAALAEPAPLSPTWAPDAVFGVSPPLYQELVHAALEAKQPFVKRVSVGRFVEGTAELEVDRVRASASGVCDSCVEGRAALSGTLRYDARLLGRGEVPLKVRATAVVALQVESDETGFRVLAVPRSVDAVAVDVGRLPRRLTRIADESIREWTEGWIKRREPTVVARLPREKAPLAGLRLAPEGEGLRVELRTRAVAPGEVGVPSLPSEGWSLDIAHASIVSLLQTRLYGDGPRTSLQLVPAPTALHVDHRVVTTDFRVWRVAPPGWWRDVRAMGTLKVVGDEIVVKTAAVEVTGMSEGASWADPLAAAGESVMLEEIRVAMARTTPAVRELSAGPLDLRLRVTDVLGHGATMRVRGTLAVSPSGGRAPR